MLFLSVLYKAIVVGGSSSVTCLFCILGVDASSELRYIFFAMDGSFNHSGIRC